MTCAKDRLGRLGLDKAPVESTMRKLFARVDGAALDRRLAVLAWTRTGHRGGRRVIAIDGKTVRGARSATTAAPHLVAALDHATGVVLGQDAIEAKSNEVPAVRDLLAGFDPADLHGCVITSDAMHIYTLDLANHRLVSTTGPDGGTATSTTTRHYTDGSDNPTWVDVDPDANGPNPAVTTRFAESLGGDLGVQIGEDGSADLTLATLHGDTATTLTLPATQDENTACTGIDAWSDYTEYGQSRNTASTDTVDGPAGYGWLGAKQRSTTPESAGLTLMGDRYYNPTTGRFTATDPVAGGNVNTYTYPNDPRDC